MYAGEVLSVPTVVHAPPATLRWMRTTCAARSGSTTARTSTVPRSWLPSAGASMVTSGFGTDADRAPDVLECPALSSTTAR